METFQFFCTDHKYGWNIISDGIDEGCVFCKMQDEEADKVDAAYEKFSEQ